MNGISIYTWPSDDLDPRIGTAVEVTSRTLHFTQPVKPGDAVRIAKTGENIIVLRERKRGGGWVVQRAAGALRRHPFGKAEYVRLGNFS